jgi:hypothetical protein
MFIYRQPIYTEIDLSNSIFGSLLQALPNMFLTMVGTAKVTQGITASSALKEKFPSWKYFIGEFEQYIAGTKRVSSFPIINFSGIHNSACR